MNSEQNKRLSFRSNGKLLLSGEYLVLHGAQAFAVPLRMGQSLTIEHLPKKENQLLWTVRDARGDWFWVSFQTIPTLSILDSDNNNQAVKLHQALLATSKVNPKFQFAPGTYLASNAIEFDRDWGLGTSSSFISNLGYWMDADPYLIHAELASGSGFDIACARAQKPLLYSVQHSQTSVTEVHWNPPFMDRLAFVYLGQKQNSEDSIRQYAHTPMTSQTIEEISALSRAIMISQNLSEFQNLISKHEQIMSAVLQQPSIGETGFPDFDGSIKSLGAWGGDFILAASASHFDQTKAYFSRHGYAVIFSSDIILH